MLLVIVALRKRLGNQVISLYQQEVKNKNKKVNIARVCTIAKFTRKRGKGFETVFWNEPERKSTGSSQRFEGAAIDYAFIQQ